MKRWPYLLGTIAALFAGNAILNAQAKWGDAGPHYAFANPSSHKFGWNSESTSSTEESIWEGDEFYVGATRCPAETSAFTLEIASSLAGNTADITVQGLDANWNEQSVTVTLTGQTPVQVGAALSWMRVNRAFYVTSTITPGIVAIASDDTWTAGVPDNAATTLQAAINTTANQTLQACFTVPDGYVADIADVCASNASSSNITPVRIALRITDTTGVSRAQTVFSLSDQGGSSCVPVDGHITYPARSLIEMTTLASGAQAQTISGSFNYTLRRAQ